MSSATAETVLANLSAQLNSFVCFLRIDLSPVILLGPGTKPTPCLGSHRLGTMATFIRQEGLPDNHNTKKALQHRRTLMRFESQFGSGITLLLIPVLPAFRSLSLAEEARAIELLQGNDFTSVRQWAYALANLRVDYQYDYGIYPSKLICAISLARLANILLAVKLYSSTLRGGPH
ncbi:hypothetical protein F1880_008383 [Penicillium rolfsii]|nr:hypothetical protein F1880_008383 [Penicillium rolfsii]